MRTRLLVGVVAAVLAVLAASSITVYVLMRASLVQEFDSGLASKARAIAAQVRHEAEDDEEKVALEDVPEPVRATILERAAGRSIQQIERERKGGKMVYEVELAADDEEIEFRVEAAEAAVVQERVGRVRVAVDATAFPELQRVEGPEYAELWLPDGTVLYRSPSLDGRDLGRVSGTLERPGRAAVSLPDGRRGRVAGATFAPRGGRGLKPVRVELAVARDTEDMARTLARLGLLLGLVCAVATVVSAVVLTWIVRLGLRPVDRLAREIGSVGEDNLSARVQADGAPAELQTVVGRLNDLLGRLEGAFERERAFSADVAHELRTPLAGLRTTLEVAVAGERSLAGFEQGLRESLGISCQMGAMVENLLAMARCETGREEVACERVDLACLLRECWRDLAGPAAGRGLRVEWQLDEPCELTTDRDKLGLIVRNLLGNAVAYADEGGSVVVAGGPQDGSVAVRVSNSGSELTAEEGEHVFERFWRGDKARSATGVHCGLGLALCERLAALLGGSIGAKSVPGGEFAVALTLPVSASSQENGGAAPAGKRAGES